MSRKTRPEFAQYPFVWLALSFAGGVVSAKYSDFGVYALAVAGAAGAIAAALGKPRVLAGGSLLVAFWAVGGLCFRAETSGVADDRLRTLYSNGRIASGEPLRITGVLSGAPEPSYEGIFLRLAVDEIFFRSETIKATGNLRIFVSVADAEAASELEKLNLANNSRIRVDCAPRREDEFRNPGGRSRIEALDEKGIDAVATIKSPLQIEKVGSVSSVAPTNFIFGLRRRAIEAFRSRFEIGTAGVMIASLLGDKYFLDKRTADLFRDGGTFHVLVISGMHITVIGGLVVLAVSFVTRSRFWQFLAASVFLWSYTLAVGADIPVVRASLVFTLLLLSRVIYRDGPLLNSLGACAVALIALRPTSIFTPSFQLTFASVGAIVGIAFPLIANFRRIGMWMPDAAEPLPPSVNERLRRFCETLYWRDELWEFESRRQIYSGNLFKRPYFRFGGETQQKSAAYVFEALLVSLIVQLCLLPPMVFYFHRVSIAGIVLNVWVGVGLAVETGLALAAVVTEQISAPLAVPLIRLAEASNSLILLFTRFVLEHGLASFRLPVYSGWARSVYLLYFVPAAVAAAIVFRWKPFARERQFNRTAFITAAVCLVTIGSVILLHPLSRPRPNGRLTVDFLDVGQGDSALVTFPGGETMLIDGGGRADFRNDRGGNGDGFEPDAPRVGEAVVSEYLWEKGYSRIDYIVATHADSDHVQGLADVAANFSVGEAIVGPPGDGGTAYDELLKTINEKNITVRTLAGGEAFSIGNARVEIPSFPAAGASNNDSSIVMRIAFGRRSFLLTGDIERRAESALDKTRIGADVVKVPHHGSRTSSTQSFVDAAGATFAVISVGRRSPFGHPHPEVVERWINSGADVLTTGENGLISFSTDGSDLTLEPFVP